GMLNLQTKRGCHFKCIYCTYPHIEGHKLRLIPPEQVAKTALQLQNAGAKYMFITDSAFNADDQHSIEVAQAFQKARVSVPWGAFFKPTNPHEDYFKFMADAGLTHVEFGTESLSDQVLTAYRKPFRRHHVFQSHKAANDAGLYVAHYFLMGGPGEDSESVNETLNAIDKLTKTVLFFFCGMRIYPHTTLYDIAINDAQIERHQNLLEPVFYQPKSISIKEIIQRVKKKAEERRNLIIGSGGEETARIISQMFERGFSGPLWEFLIR
ncbi:MAG: radical SAM protein, partial [Desulfobacterales bacterium]